MRLSLVLAVLVVLVMYHGSVYAARPSWWSCVRDIGLYFEPKSSTVFEWALNPCGYTSLSMEDVRAGVFYANDNTTVAFAGDSTALRAYVFAVNTYLPPLNIPVIRKVATVPRVMTHQQSSSAYGGGSERTTYATFYNMRYVSTSRREIEEGIMGSNGGVLVITLGNWDLNWKLQRNSPMPHLKGGVHNLEAAKAYWTEHVGAMMENIARCLSQRPLDKRPLVVFREQFFPNCGASRFTSKKARYRRCAPLIRPIVVPLYRRVLAPLAWSMNIPVVPMDHVFKENYKYCAMGDGIHLDFDCMMTEQQHVWNVALMLRRHKVRQGLGTVSHEGGGLPDARLFLNATRYEEWRRATDMVGGADGTLASSPAADASTGAPEVEAPGPPELPDDGVLPPHASHLVNGEGSPPPPPPVSRNASTDGPIELRVVVTDRAANARDNISGLTLAWDKWQYLIVSSAFLVTVTAYLSWAASRNSGWGPMVGFD